jgi:hypothetical protein
MENGITYRVRFDVKSRIQTELASYFRITKNSEHKKYHNDLFIIRDKLLLEDWKYLIANKLEEKNKQNISH